MKASRDASLRAILCPLFVLAACAKAPPPPSQPSPLLSHSMPSFEGDTLSRNHFYTAQASEYPMVVKFFSSDCSACRGTLKAVQRVYEDDSNLVVVGVSEDASAAEARQLVDQLGLHFPVIVDEGGRISKLYQVSEMPAAFVITPHGTVKWVGGAGTTEETLRAAVRAARD